MKEEVREALNLIKTHMVDPTWVMNHYDEERAQEAHEFNEAIAIIERALTDTTLEIVKRKLQQAKEEMLTRTAFSERRRWSVVLQSVLEDIITEAEGKK
jgi:hypothetical protein